MNNRLFSPRNLASSLVIIFSIYACGGGLPATEAPFVTEVPAVTEAPIEPTPVVVDQYTQTAIPVVIIPTQSLATPIVPPTQMVIMPVIPETRRLTLEYPPKMKAGVEGDVVRLTLEVDDLGNITPTAQVGGNIVTGEVIEIPNLYETHFVTAEARFDIAGMLVQPSGSIYEPMKPGQSVTFYWSIRPQEPGIYRGTLWLHLVFEERVSGEESRMAVSAQVVEIEAVDFFGFSVNFVRTSGVVGSVLGLIVGFPFFDDIVKLLFKKRKKKTKKK